MTDQELRVAVAKDVLERIVGDRNIEVLASGYLHVQGGNACQVCAIGGLALTALENHRLGDAQGVSDRVTLEGIQGNNNALKSFVDNTLGRVFTPLQLGLIEAAFEGRFTGFWGNLEIKRGLCVSAISSQEREGELNAAELDVYLQFADAIQFSRMVNGSPRDRLKAIMRNIISNEGTFIP